MANQYKPNDSISGGETYNSRRARYNTVNYQVKKNVSGVKNIKINQKKIKELVRLEWL